MSGILGSTTDVVQIYISEQEPLTNFRRDVAAEFEYWWWADLLARRIRRRGFIRVAWLVRRIRLEMAL